MEQGLSLVGKKILVTGVSRSTGIGAAIVKLLVENGAQVVLHGYSAFDLKENFTGAKRGFPAIFASELSEQGYSVSALEETDLSDPSAPACMIQEAIKQTGFLNGMVLNHAFSEGVDFGEWTAEHIDKTLEVNVRASMLMIQEFAKQLPTDESGAITLFTSGQYLGPMPGEIAYAVSKEAVLGLCRQAAAVLAPQNIRVNCLNPGPTDTGYLSGEPYQELAKLFPSGRWGMPEDAARLVHFLQSDYSRWITGEIISSEGGFNRYR